MPCRWTALPRCSPTRRRTTSMPPSTRERAGADRARAESRSSGAAVPARAETPLPQAGARADRAAARAGRRVDLRQPLVADRGLQAGAADSRARARRRGEVAAAPQHAAPDLSARLRALPRSDPPRARGVVAADDQASLRREDDRSRRAGTVAGRESSAAVLRARGRG